MFVITGGGTGIGQALALALAQRDQQVMIIGRNEATLKATADQHPSIDYISSTVHGFAKRRPIYGGASANVCHASHRSQEIHRTKKQIKFRVDVETR